MPLHYTPNITVSAANRDWHLSRAGNIEELWEKMKNRVLLR